jgi:ParB family chromosome partitioning protein
MMCNVLDVNDKEAFEISMVENLERRSLNPIEEAEAYRKYVYEYGWGTASELAKKIGRSTSYVTRKIKLLDFPDEIVDAIEKMSISESIAQELFTVPGDAGQSELARLITRRHLSFRAARTLIKEQNLKSEEGIAYTSSRPEDQMINSTFDSVLSSLNKCANRLGSAIANTDSSWITYEILIGHKHRIDSQIDLLL